MLQQHSPKIVYQQQKWLYKKGISDTQNKHNS